MAGGHGPPVVLLHSYPQTHVSWHAVAPRLALDFPDAVRRLAVLDVLPALDMERPDEVVEARRPFLA